MKFNIFSATLVMASAIISMTSICANAASAPFKVSVTSSPAIGKHGAPVSLATTVTPQAGALTSGVVDTEVYNAKGKKVAQNWLTNTSIGANKTSTFKYKWTPSASGVYTVKVGIFNSKGGAPLYWNNEADSVVAK